MSMDRRYRAAWLALLLAPLAACGEGPQKLSRAEAQAERAPADPTLPPSHPPMGGGQSGLPAGHPPTQTQPGLPAGHPPLGGEPGLPAGHPPMGGQGGLPAGHPPMGGGGEEVTALAGEIELAGPLAALEAGAVFLVGYDKQTGGMALVEKLDVGDFVREAAGTARLPFRMTQAHVAASGGLAELELEVRIDLDGMVETKGDVVARTRVPASLGDQDLRVRVDEGARTEAPLPSGG